MPGCASARWCASSRRSPTWAGTWCARGPACWSPQSATSTFQESWAPAQHASLAALRAAETGRPVVHATLTGISAVHGPSGEPVGPRLPVSASTAEVYEIPLARGTTAYVRFGDWAVAASVLLLAGCGAGAGVRALRLRRPAPGPSAPPARTARG
ncbi:hypothetical protein [Streptomyces sp. CS62]|uniref:hypothetical protein n=1 Tax=Streptomyces sp. CS62 TaxID=3119268 RepID=UPI003FA74DAE